MQGEVTCLKSPAILSDCQPLLTCLASTLFLLTFPLTEKHLDSFTETFLFNQIFWSDDLSSHMKKQIIPAIVNCNPTDELAKAIYPPISAPVGICMSGKKIVSSFKFQKGIFLFTKIVGFSFFIYL